MAMRLSLGSVSAKKTMRKELYRQGDEESEGFGVSYRS